MYYEIPVSINSIDVIVCTVNYVLHIACGLNSSHKTVIHLYTESG